ncbi:hypothetical protein KKA15_04865 [Patescibacteria group bacterium]|nr:hypothetical protein [Patescibacteria group bacterium]
MTQQNQTSPTARDKTVKGPKALFWYLTLFFTLGITAFSTGGLWFQFINKWIPREVRFDQVVEPFSQSVLKGQMAALIVAVPVFFTFLIFIRRSLKKNNLAADSKIRLWITYVILFIVIAIAVGDLISTTFALLSGEFTTRFLLKSLSILIIVAWIFSYFWLELRSETTLTNSKIPRLMGIISLVIIIISFIGTFFIVESPAQARRKAYDRTRINNLQEITYAVNDYYLENETLPNSLNELESFRTYIQIVDPKTGQAYEYKVVDENSYELCAEFDTSSEEGIQDKYYGSPYAEFVYQGGRNCFTKKAILPGQEPKMLRAPEVPQ